MVDTENLAEVAFENYKKIKESNVQKFDTIDKWLYKESSLFLGEISRKKSKFKKFRRGQIIKVDFGINPGAELCYTHFAIVLTKKDSIYSDNLIVIPITSKKGNNENRLNIGKILENVHPYSNKYDQTCYLNVSQIKAISKSRIFIEKKRIYM